ncbi:endoplasmic reticulum oxidoreductin-1 [Tanacetum coccineum]
MYLPRHLLYSYSTSPAEYGPPSASLLHFYFHRWLIITQLKVNNQSTLNSDNQKETVDLYGLLRVVVYRGWKLGEPGPSLPDLELDSSGESCQEKKVLYKLISGLHASISVHIASDYLLDRVSQSDEENEARKDMILLSRLCEGRRVRWTCRGYIGRRRRLWM